MKIKIIPILILLLLVSCKKESSKNYDEELTNTIQNKITEELKQDEALISVKLIKKVNLTEPQELDALLRYSNYNLIRLNEKQKQLIERLEKAKNTNDLELNKLEYEKLSDSINYYSEIGRSVRYLKPKNFSTGNYQAIFLTEILNRKTNTIKKDSLFIYINDKKVIFTEAQFVKQSITKFEKKKK